MATMTITEPPPTLKLKSVFHLPKPKQSIFSNIKMKEYPTMTMIYGFIEKQMGIKLRKHIAQTYRDEQTHYQHYIKEYDINEDAIRVEYSLNAHGWGRGNAKQSLSLSLFHRPTRHAFAKQNYLDLDMVSAQPKMFLELAILEGIETSGLKEYCENPKKIRREIVKHYKLKDKIFDDGTTITAMEQAKKLPIRMAFGGGIKKWREEFVDVRVEEMPLIKNLEITLKKIRKIIIEENPHIKEDLEKYGSEEYKKKTADEKERSVMALFIQTWERLIQEHAISYMVRTYNLALCDIIPSQDGFMPLKQNIIDKKINITSLLTEMKESVKREFNMEIDWALKPFDEAFEIPHSDIVPLKLTEKDLEKGETNIATMIAPCLKNKIIYSNKTGLWYYTDKRNVWIKSKKPNEYFIVNTIQYYIKELQDEIWREIGKEKEKDKKAELNALKKRIDKWYKVVGQSAFQTQITKYLRTLLQDDFFPTKLDNTGGKVVFYDGIFDLKLGKFERGIKKDDFVSITLSTKYKMNPDKDKIQFIRDTLKKIANNNEEHLEYILGLTGFAFTGDAHLEKSLYYVMDGTEGKMGDNGKTFWFGILEHFFPEYVRMTDPTFLEENNKNLNKQLINFNGVRILYADEGTKKKLNHSILKKVGDGETIEVCAIYSNSLLLKISYKLFVCSNHIPQINSAEENAVYNRYKQIELCSHFCRDGTRTEENPEKLEWIADPTLRDKIRENYEEEIIAIMLDYGMKYYKKGIPKIPTQFLDATNKTKIENNKFAMWFYENYEESENGKISIWELECGCPDKFATRKGVLGQLPIMRIEWDKRLKGFGTRTDNDGKQIEIVGGIKGYCKKQETEEEY